MKKEFLLFATYIGLCVALVSSCEKESKELPQLPDNVTIMPHTPLSIGQTFGGGIVFSLDSTGKHGLIVAKISQGQSVAWYNGNMVTTYATITESGGGKENTTAIVAAQGQGTYAASICDRLELSGYTDWYLPSKDELQLLYEQKAAGRLFGLTDDFYWSSTEASLNGAWSQSFSNGATSSADKQGTYAVRAIRSF